MQITGNTTPTTPGPKEWFTGEVSIDSVATPGGCSRASASYVHFAPAARTVWHAHPYWQTIYITEVSLGYSGAVARLRKSVPATATSSSRARTPGTAPPPIAS